MHPPLIQTQYTLVNNSKLTPSLTVFFLYDTLLIECDVVSKENSLCVSGTCLVMGVVVLFVVVYVITNVVVVAVANMMFVTMGVMAVAVARVVTSEAGFSVFFGCVVGVLVLVLGFTGASTGALVCLDVGWFVVLSVEYGGELGKLLVLYFLLFFYCRAT